MGAWDGFFRGAEALGETLVFDPRVWKPDGARGGWVGMSMRWGR